MAKIELLFGEPTTKRRWENIEDYIYRLDVNYETAVILKFKSILYSLLEKKEADKNYFEMIAEIAMRKEYKLPKISFGTYRHNGFMFPKIILNSLYMKEIKSDNFMMIPKKLIDEICFDFENEFEFEYCEFIRIGKVIPQKNELIYSYRNKSHVYCEGQFIEALLGK